MTAFDIIVLVIIGVAAIGGFLRGLVQEVASLAAWVLVIFAIRYMHTDLTTWLDTHIIPTQTGAALLAFALLLLIPYAGAKLLARQVSDLAHNSVLNPIDRVLGFCFGAIKGAIVVVLAYSLLVIGYEPIWEEAGRPAWITEARSYELINQGADALVQLIEDRRAMFFDADAAEEPAPAGDKE
jgi:membrane protein required for colicin V production